MGSHANQVKTGVFTATGVDKSIVLGFKPRKVIVYNVTDRITFRKTDTMPTNLAMTRDVGGIGTFVARMTINSDGFTVLAAAAVDTKVLHYEATQGENE